MSFVVKLMSAVGRLFTTTETAIVEQGRIQDLQNVLWQEWHRSDDEAYRQHLARLVADASISWETRWGSRPLAMAVEDALRQACQLLPQAETTWADPLRLLTEKQKQPDSPDRLIADLKSDDWVKRFVARHTLVSLGGEAVSHLSAIATDKKSPFRQTAIWLLRSIEVETTARLFPRLAHRLVCTRCLLSCRANWTHPSGALPFVYYGCPSCTQSQEFWDGLVVAVLDAKMVEETRLDGVLRADWLTRRALFDFNWVEIIQATDEDVERFAVQVGNDTDPFREPRYEQMRCLIRPDCQLSENTLRILESMFGTVEWMSEVTNEG